MTLALLVGLGSGLGAICRYAVSLLSKRYAPHISLFNKSMKIPLGTILVNTIGCYLIGVFSTLDFGIPYKEHFQASLIAGYLGGLTTYSTFGYESYSLLKNKRYGTMLTYISAQLVLGAIFIWFGIYSAQGYKT